jgi:hypothetical protein
MGVRRTLGATRKRERGPAIEPNNAWCCCPGASRSAKWKRRLASSSAATSPALAAFTQSAASRADALTTARVPAGPVNDISGAFAPADRLGLVPIVALASEDGREGRLARNPIRLSETPPTYPSPPPPFLPCPGAPRCHSRGWRLVLWGAGILDHGVDDESVCGRCDGSDWKAAGAASGCRGS